MTIRGFGVSGQNRDNLRRAIKGVYNDIPWRIECAKPGLFQWEAGEVSGWTLHDSTVEDGLRDIKRASECLTDIKNYFADRNGLSKDAMRLRIESISRVMRWLRMSTQGRLKIDMKRRKCGSVYYNVEEI